MLALIRPENVSWSMSSIIFFIRLIDNSLDEIHSFDSFDFISAIAFYAAFNCRIWRYSYSCIFFFIIKSVVSLFRWNNALSNINMNLGESSFSEFKFIQTSLINHQNVFAQIETLEAMTPFIFAFEIAITKLLIHESGSADTMASPPLELQL